MKSTIAAGSFTVLLAVSAFAQSDAQSSIQLKGEVLPAAQTDVKPQAAGRIKKLHVRQGDQVKTGDLIAEIDELISEEAADNRASLSKVHAPCGGTILTVPIVERQVVTPATDGKSGTTLMTIGDLSKLLIQTHIPESEVSKLALKQAVQVSAGSIPGEQMTAAISFIAPIATPKDSVKGFAVQALLEKPSPRLHPGMNVQVAIPIAAAKKSP